MYEQLLRPNNRPCSPRDSASRTVFTSRSILDSTKFNPSTDITQAYKVIIDRSESKHDRTPTGTLHPPMQRGIKQASTTRIIQSDHFDLLMSAINCARQYKTMMSRDHRAD